MVMLTVLFCKGLTVNAASGDWIIHPVFSNGQKNVVSVGKYVFFLSDNSLYRYDKSSGTVTAGSKRSILNGNSVSDIYYNLDKDYAIIAYNTSNIDVVSSDGSITNIPDIADMVLPVEKGINNVSFNGASAYIATDFGYVVYNHDSKRIIESNVYYNAVTSVAKIGSNIWINANGKLLYASSGKSHASLAKFTEASGVTGEGNIVPVGNDSFLFADTRLSLVKIGASGALSSSTLYEIKFDQVIPTSTGFLATCKALSYLLTMDKAGSVVNLATLGGELSGALASASDSNGNLWLLNTNGICQARISGSNVTKTGKWATVAAASMQRPGNLFYNTSSNKLYVATDGPSRTLSSYQVPAYVNTLQNGEWTDITPSDVPVNNGSKLLYDLKVPIFDPDDANTYYCGTWFEGAYKITGNKVVMHYDWNNSPIEFVTSWYALVCGIQFDAAKNLWIMSAGAKKHAISVLPKSKRSKSKLTASDWITVDVNIPDGSDYRAKFMIAKKSNMKIMFSGKYDSELAVFDDGGNPSSSNINLRKFEAFVDEENNSFDAHYHYCLFEDNNGYVWLGTSNGVIKFDPAKALNSDFRVIHPRVTESNGSSDYLLNGENVYCIASDNAGNLWMGTLDSGVYKISSDGTKILEHFDTSNSYLTSDRIISLACKPDGSAIYIGTESGLVEYRPDATASEKDYSKVSVSPLNVSPDYTGYVVIEHLADNSTVTITDINGTKVTELKADGGIATWNLLNSGGDRISTGKYLLYASTDSIPSEKIGYVNVLR